MTMIPNEHTILPAAAAAIASRQPIKAEVPRSPIGPHHVELLGQLLPWLDGPLPAHGVLKLLQDALAVRATLAPSGIDALWRALATELKQPAATSRLCNLRGAISDELPLPKSSVFDAPDRNFPPIRMGHSMADTTIGRDRLVALAGGRIEPDRIENVYPIERRNIENLASTMRRELMLAKGRGSGTGGVSLSFQGKEVGEVRTDQEIDAWVRAQHDELMLRARREHAELDKRRQAQRYAVDVVLDRALELAAATPKLCSIARFALDEARRHLRSDPNVAIGVTAALALIDVFVEVPWPTKTK